MKVCPTCNAEYTSGEMFCPLDATRLTSASQFDAPAVRDPEDPLVGATLGGRYRIVRRIGEGGMGIVYEALHVVIEKRVALKVLRDDFSGRTEVVERFRQEAKSASRIGHQHIVDISDFGETPGGQSYFVMEYLEGEDLANVLARQTTVPIDRAVDIVLQCCKALGAAHAKGIVHRDMKPENVFLTRRDGDRDFVKIVDFGIAKMSDIDSPGVPGRKLTKTGMIFGTPEYMSPEQAAGKPLDHRVDVYAVSVILYEMLTGRVPFVGDSFMGILTQHMFEEAPPLRTVNANVESSPELEAVIFHGLAKDPDDRFGSMEELARAVSAAADMTDPFGDSTLSGYGEPVKALQRAPRRVVPQPTAEFPAERRKGKSWIAAAVVIGMAVVGAVGAAAVLLPRDRGEGDPPAVIPAVPAPEPGNVGQPPVDPAPGPADPQTPEPSNSDGDPTAGNGALVAAGDRDAPSANEPALVSISVATSPSGVPITVDGRGTVCARSPCTFETRAGTSIRLRARRGALRAVRDLSPDASQDLVMELSRPAVTHSEGGRTGTPPGGRPAAGDLKIPDWAAP